MIDLILEMIVFLISLIATWWGFKKVLKIAVTKNIVDNPNERKLHPYPVPVLGGVAIFFGICCALMFAAVLGDCGILFTILPAMIVILYVGTMDDILSLSANVRFCIEVIIVLFLIASSKFSINDFHGLWGIDEISAYYAVPLTVFAAVGIINAINLIDGVNGLSSGFGLVTCVIYTVIFYKAGDTAMLVLMLACLGALIPFYFHNVFGKSSKMFIGDGGTLLLGLIFSLAVINLLHSDSPFEHYAEANLGLVPFTLATLAIPVFDTLRVMTSRIVHGQSPFHPDKNHLHHLLLGVKFSHIGITCTEILLNLLIILCWWISYKAGASIDMQLYVVIFFGVLFTFGLAQFIRYLMRRQNKAYFCLCRFGASTHFGKTKFFITVRNFLDRNCKFD